MDICGFCSWLISPKTQGFLPNESSGSSGKCACQCQVSRNLNFCTFGH